MGAVDSASFVYWYCATVAPVTLAVGIWAHIGASGAARRNRERIEREARSHREAR
jgi:hypothetical protein